MLTFDADQTSLVADDSKEYRWVFTVTDNTDTAVSTPVITDFSGIDLKRNTSEAGIIAPSDVTFSISDAGDVIGYSNLKGGTVLIELYITSPTVAEHKIAGWMFKIKTAEPGYQQIKIVAQDFLQDYLQGYYPNTRLPEEIFPSSRTYNGDMVCVPLPFGSAYVPLRDVFITDAGYLMLGDPAHTYTLAGGGADGPDKIRSPRSVGMKTEWDHASFTFTQSTKTAADATTWRVFQAIIADGNKDGVVDTHGFWGTPGGPILDPPVLFSRDDTATTTNPADIIAFVLEDMGVPSAMIDDGVGSSFAAAHAIFDAYTVPLVFNGAFWYKQDRQKVLSQLLTQCHACLDVGETIKMRVLSKTSKATITDADVLRTSDQGPGSFQYQDIVNEDLSDAAYGAYQETGEAQDELKQVLVSTGGAATVISSEVIPCPFVQDSRDVKRIVTLTLQRKLGKIASVNWLNKGTALALQPDDVLTVNDSNYGGSHTVLIDSMKINKDLSISFSCTKFKQALSDWADLSPTTQVIPVDDTTHPWSPVISGPDSPGTPIPLNAIADRLRVGNGAANYILIEPADPRISLYNSGEKWRVGNLNGYLGVASDLFGLGIGESEAGKANLIYDVTDGLRLRSGTTNVVNIDNAGNITISGGIIASTIAIGTSPNWFNVDASGNIWSGQDTLANAQANTFAVSNAGVMNAITGYLGGSTNGWQIAAGTITSLGTGKIQTAASGARSVLDSAGLAIYDATTQRAKIGSDGAGWLGASTTIAWTSAGVVTVAGFTTDSTDLTKTAGGNTTIVSSGATAFTAGPTGSPTFTVTQAGVLNATGVTVSGAITATSGTFTGTVNAADGYFGGSTNGWVIAAGSLTAKGTSIFQTSASAATGIKIDSTSLRGYNGTVQTVNIATDGSGWVGLTGTKAIQWTTAGVVSLGNWTVNASSIQTGAFDTAGTMYFGTSGISLSNTFKVTAAGALTATGVTVTGAINASSGTFSGNLLVTGTLQTSATAATGLKFSSAGIKGYGTANDQTIEINADGSGWFGPSAAKVISWTAAGVATIGGLTANATSLWQGGTGVYQAAATTLYVGQSGISLTDKFSVTTAGALIATDATITGAITATSGTFTGTINATAGKFGTSTNYWSVGATGLTATSASTDVIIAYGKTDFGDATKGFILGYDFSASKPKFEMGDATSNIAWTGDAWTFTKGTLVENIIQMYTNVATLKTSATAGDGSADSAGIVVTYEGLFGCGASQTATIAAANANVRILATGAAYFSGTVTAGAGAIGGFTIGTDYIKDAADSFGLASTVTAGDDVRFWAGDTFANRATADFRITEAGALFASSATVIGDYKTIATVGVGVKGVHLSAADNELYFYGPEQRLGAGDIVKLVSIGTDLSDSNIATFGALTSTRPAIYAEGTLGKIVSDLGYLETNTSGNLVGFSSIIYANTPPTAWLINGIYPYLNGIKTTAIVNGGSGTFHDIGSIVASYGHGASTTATTSVVVGLKLAPSAEAGTITSLRDLYIESPVSGGTITTHYAIYQEDAAAKNFWAGYHLAKGGIRIGTTDTDPGDNNLYVEGTCAIAGISTFTGLIKTVGGLHVGGTSDPGADNLLVDGTLHVDGIQTSAGIIMDNNATIGQAAGPLIAFDDTNNYLEITGCNVGIGSPAPGYKLTIAGTSHATTPQVFVGSNLGFGSYDSNYAWIQSFASLPLYINAQGNNTIINPTSGNVGIGTKNPASLTEIQGGLTTTGAVLTLGSKETSTVANNVLGRINFYAPLDASGTDAILPGASIVAMATATFSASVNSTALCFQTGNSETAVGQTRMQIGPTGGVTVGDSGTDPGLHNLLVDGTLHVDGVATLASIVNEGTLQSAGKLTIDHIGEYTGSHGIYADTRIILGDGIQPYINDGISLGLTATAFSDLFLADGGTIGWNEGNTILTHSSNALALSGTAATSFSATGSIKANNMGVLQGDATGGRVVRVVRFEIANGTDPNTIKPRTVNRWNGDAIASEDNLGKSGSTTNFSLDAFGYTLTWKGAGITGDPIAVLSATVEWSGTTAANVVAQVVSSDITIALGVAGTAATMIDLTALVDTGVIVLNITYITSA
jgi:hypothetical protein